jgi:hypothetical protein
LIQSDRAEIVKTGIESDGVIENLDIVEDGGAGVGTDGEAVAIGRFVFEGAPEGSNGGGTISVIWAMY